MNALNVEAKLVAIASTPITTSINAIIFVYKIRQWENVPCDSSGQSPASCWGFVNFKIFTQLYICPLSTNNFRILEAGQKINVATYCHLGMCDKTIDCLIDYNLNFKRKHYKWIFTPYFHSPTIVNTPTLHQGAFNTWMWNNQESHTKTRFLEIFIKVVKTGNIRHHS